MTQLFHELSLSLVLSMFCSLSVRFCPQLGQVLQDSVHHVTPELFVRVSRFGAVEASAEGRRWRHGARPEVLELHRGPRSLHPRRTPGT